MLVLFGTNVISIQQAAGALDIDVASMSNSVTDFVSSATSQGADIDTSSTQTLAADALVMEHTQSWKSLFFHRFLL